LKIFSYQFWKVSPFLFKLDDFSVTYYVGDEANLSCFTMVGFQEGQNISWIWKFDKHFLDAKNLSSKYAINSFDTSSSLTIKNVSFSDIGMYECICRNEFGSVSRSVFLRVKSKSFEPRAFLIAIDTKK
jgi:hypothetical protein